MSKGISLYIILALLLYSPRANAQEQGPADTARQEVETMRNNPFGVLEFLHWNHNWNNFKYPADKELKKAVQLMKEAGVGIVRMDFLWDEIEPRQGEFDFAKYDRIVEIVRKEGLEILGILDYSAPWATATGLWNYPPQENQFFVDFSAQVISRYKGKIKYWEIWNEPDAPTYWAAQDGLKSYCRLLKEVYLAAKKANPECKILNGGLANGISSVNRLYDNGAKDYFDILNIHIFASPLHFGAVKRAAAYPRLTYKVMLRNGDGEKKIWVTEIGCPGVKRSPPVANWWLGENPTERQQAKWLKEAYAALLKNERVEKIFWAFFRDCDSHWGNGVDYFGIVRWDFSKKPAFSAYRESYEEWKRK
ncbi:MAG: cellulase family glycosylhydrolase [Candidatus Omnitrophota bacterium]|nr:cellulase family glycosylhydrolase [Candidatus Omnitrophota bacterium]